MKVERALYQAKNLRHRYTGHYARQDMVPVDTLEEANLRSSKVTMMGWKRTLMFSRENLHAPALDIDGIHCELIPSSTKGNFHLYIDKPMPWEDYKKLLKVLTEVGIVEQKYYDASMIDEMTLLRVNSKKDD